MSLDQTVVTALTALSTVATLVVISVGLAVIFGTMRIINLAHGEFLMMGAFVELTVVREGVNFWLALLIAPIIVGAIGLLIERGLIRFLYGRLLDTMLATWGLSLILVQLAVIIYGPTTRGVPPPLGSVRIGDFLISQYSLVMVGFALLLLAITYFVFTRTRYGVLAQATSQGPEMAAALGVNADRINMLTFTFGAALTGAAGAMLAPITAVVPSMGAAFVAQAFMTVVVGGPVVLSGTSAAAVLLGTTSNLVARYVTAFAGQAALLLVAILVIRILPEGISSRWRLNL